MSSDSRLAYDADGLNTGSWPVVAAGHFITPIERFFTRSHAPIPDVDPASYVLRVDGLVRRPCHFSLAELTTRFPRRVVDATLVCAGLRRAEFLALGPLPGELPWGPEPISTGSWGGISLSDVLRTVEVGAEARYVEFIGLDQVEREGATFGFGGSIDLAKALEGDVLLATELNGEPLPAMHGFPLRAVVPGWIGARSVKWLGRITLGAEPSNNYFQSKAYRTQRSLIPDRPRDVSGGDALDEVPLNAFIVEPAGGADVNAGQVTLRGWAMGSASQPLASVDVSADGGEWHAASISVRGTEWTWSFWEAVLTLGPGPHVLAVRATDRSGTSQPAELRETWNVKGYANNAWHRVGIIAV